MLSSACHPDPIGGRGRGESGDMENSNRGGLNRKTAVASHVAVAPAIPPFLPLSLDQLHAGDTRDCLAAICRHCDIIRCFNHKSTFICRKPHSARLEKVNFPDEKDLEDFLPP